MFRGRYKGILIDADEYLAAVVRYIHLNAVAAGLVKMPEAYRWASHQYYLKAKGAPDWLDSREAIEQIGGRQVFHEFVLSGNEPTLRQYYEAKRQSPILGTESLSRGSGNEESQPPGSIHAMSGALFTRSRNV